MRVDVCLPGSDGVVRIGRDPRVLCLTRQVVIDEDNERVLAAITLLGEGDDERVLIPEHVRRQPSARRGRLADVVDPRGRAGHPPAEVSNDRARVTVIRGRHDCREPGGDGEGSTVGALLASLEDCLLERRDVQPIEPRPHARDVEHVQHAARPGLGGDRIVLIEDLPAAAVDDVVHR